MIQQNNGILREVFCFNFTGKKTAVSMDWLQLWIPNILFYHYSKVKWRQNELHYVSLVSRISWQFSSYMRDKKEKYLLLFKMSIKIVLRRSETKISMLFSHEWNIFAMTIRAYVFHSKYQEFIAVVFILLNLNNASKTSNAFIPISDTRTNTIN